MQTRGAREESRDGEAPATMSENAHRCVCGTSLVRETEPSNTGQVECSCGRMHECVPSDGAWTGISEPIMTEPRQPLAGFSRELHQQEDIRRYYFKHPLGLGHRLPVHVLFLSVVARGRAVGRRFAD